MASLRHHILTRRPSRLALALGVFATVFAMVPDRPVAAADPTLSVRVKAAVLYNFARFVAWPDTAFSNGDAFRICVIGKDPFGEILDKTLAGKKVSGRDITAVRPTRLIDLAKCHVAYIAQSESRTLPTILSGVDQRPVLTVSEISGFPDTCGMVGLDQEASGKINLSIDLDRTRKAGLSPSAHLLRLMKVVDGKCGGS